MCARLICNATRDRCLASGFGHAMGFDSPAGLQGLKPSGPLSNPRSDLLGPSLLISLSALSDACRAPVVSGFEFVMDFEFNTHRRLYGHFRSEDYTF